MAFPIAGAVPAAAQRLSFERAIDVMPGATLDVSTIRGKIAVRAHDGRQIRIDGTVTVRVGLSGVTVPANALELAQRVADHPRIDVADNVVRLRPPTDADELRAVTVSYDVRVPRDTRLIIATDSGAITVDDVAAAVVVTTQSSAVALSGIDGKTEIKTGSGDIRVDRASGGLRVVTQSSAITLRGLSGPLDARTQSGAVRASFAGPGAADVETGSSAIQIDGLTGGLTVRTQSGRVEVRGNPTPPGTSPPGRASSTSRSSPPRASPSRRPAVRARSSCGASPWTARPRKNASPGTVGGGGPIVRLASRSGQIHIGR